MDELKLYWLKEIMDMDKKDGRTVKKSFRYIPIRIQNAQTLYRGRTGKSEKDYTVKYILFSDLKEWFDKNHWKKITFL